MQYDAQTYRLTRPGNWGKLALALGLVAGAATVIGLFVDSQRFFYSYLTAYVFWFTLALGGLFFTMLHHLVNATWSVVMRRIAETVMVCLPFMALLFIPILLGLHDLYHWSHPDIVAADELLQKKQPFLNVTFFIIRSAVYFVIWFLLARSLYRTSLQQDQGHSEAQVRRVRRISAPGMILFALTTTFAAFDWVMSLDAHWYSTIFGAYLFSGAVMGVLAFMTLVVITLNKRGVLKGTITVEHYHDLGKLIFAFTIFWAYMAFSQYFLIWYANIPEETIWYHHRWDGSWKIISLIIVFGHFALPFLLLITRAAKRNLNFLRAICVWLLLMHWVDIYWLVMPTLSGHGVHISWMDFTAMIAIGGLMFWYFWWRLSSQPLVPVGDPRLAASIKFTNQ